MACLTDVSKYPEFQQLVRDSGFSESTVFDIMQRWLDDDPQNREGKFPSLEEVTSFYDSKTFFTDNSDIIEAYKRPFTSERVFGMMSSPDEIRDHISQMSTIFGKENVFVYENQNGDTVVKVAKPVNTKENKAKREITLEDIKTAKKLLRNKIEHTEGIISWIEERVKWNKATDKQLQELEEYKRELANDKELWDGLDTGASEVYINEHGVGQVRKFSGLDIRTITARTADFGVEVSNGSKDFWNKINNGWQSNNPNGLVAYRKHGDSPESFTPETVEQGWIGNPFSVEGKSKDIQTGQQFYNWLVTGNNFDNPRATEEFRQAIIKKILSTPEDSPVLYYTVLQGPSHATVIGYLINHKELIGGKKKEQEPAKITELPVVLLPAVDSDLQYFNKPTSSAVSTSYEDKPWKEPFKFFSGGEPKGADAAWGNAARQLGIEVKDFTVDDYNALPENEKNRIEREYQEVARRIGRPTPSDKIYKGQLVRRDMMQADNADAIFAVGNFEGMFVEGGTAYATMRGIILGIPVHFFNQDEEQWYIWNEQKQSFSPEVAPLLTQHAAVIGTEHLSAAGNREIVRTLQRTGRYYGLINDEETKKNEIKPTDEQQAAIDHSVEFIESKLRTGSTPSGKKFLTIQGMAGTGKTTIVRNIIQRLREDGIYGDTAVAALSRKAVHVLSSKLKDLGVSTETLYTLSGADPNASEDRFAINTNKEKFSRYSIIFVDEASMVGNKIMDTISDYLDKNRNTVVVFLGDYGQVRPIAKEGEESKKSEIFHRDDIQVETLTERIRQGEGSPILGYADKFYSVSIGKSRAPLLPTAKEDVKSVVNDSGALIFAKNMGSVFPRIIELFKRATGERNPNHVKIVSSTNAAVDNLNQRIHDALFPNAQYDIDEGDLIIFNAPYGKDIDNSEEGVVSSVGDIKTDSHGVEYRNYSLVLSDSREVTVRRIVDTRDNLDKYNKELEELYKIASRTKDRKDWAIYWGYKGAFADLALGYAMTIHKAQGSTYDIVVVDEQGIRSDGVWENQERAEIMYTALTRSRNVTISLAGVEDSGEESFAAINSRIEQAKTGAGSSVKQNGRPKNRSVRLYLKGQEEKGYFEVVKDFEDGYYSVHFKPTDSNNPHAFSEKEKDILFKAVADVIPVGGYLSTYGELSKGGVHGLSRFANLGFADTGKTRGLKMKVTGEPIAVPIYRKLGQFNDGSMSSAIAASMQGKDPGQKPPGNIVVTPLVTFNELDNIGKTVRTVQLSMLESATADDVVKAIEDRLDNDKEQVATIGVRIVPDTSSTKRFIKSVKVLNKVNPVLLKKGRPLPNQYEIPIQNLNKDEEKALRRLGLVEVNGNFLIPTYVIGMSDEELELKEKRENLMAQGNFTEVELREYAKRAVFKLSDAITKIQSGDTSILDLLVDKDAPNREEQLKAFKEDKKGNPIDYTKMSRIDIIRKIGLGRAFVAFVEKPIFRYAAGKNWSFSRKAKVISSNWDAFLELGYDALINMEEITFSDAKGKIGEMGFDIDESTGEISQSLTAENEAELAEVFGSVVEYWQVGFRQVSAFHSLSSDLRNAFGKFLSLDAEGKPTFDEFGMPITVDSSEAVAKVLSWTQHANDLKEMIDILKGQMADNPWLRQLVGEGETSYTDREGNTRIGILVDKNQSSFQSKFFSNFKKYFQSYTVTYFDNNNNVRMRTVNNNPYEDETIGNLKTLNQNGQLSVWNEKTGELTSAYDELSDIVGYSELRPSRDNPDGRKASGLYTYMKALDEVVESKGEKELVESDRQKLLSDLYRAYELLNIELPSFEVFSTLFSPKDMSDAITILGYIVDGIQSAANIADMGGYFQLFASKKEHVLPKDIASDINVKPVNLTSNFRALLQFISPAMTSSREIVSYEGGKLFYAYVTPSYLGLLTDKLKGFTGDQTYDEFIQEEYFKYEGIFNNSEKRPAKYGPKGVLNYMLSRLTDEEDGEAVRGVLEHVTSLTYDGVQYADKTKPQYYASMVSMFLYDTHGKRAFYRIPTMSNKPSEEYIRFERMSSSTYKQTIVDWLAEKTFYQELNRMKTVADRAKARENAEKSGNKDEIREANDSRISNFDNKGRDKEFFFMPFLNKYVSGDVESAEDKQFSKSLNKVLNGKGLNSTTKEGKAFIDSLKRVIEKELDSKFEEFLSDAEKAGFITISDGIIENVYQIDDRFTMDNYPGVEDYKREILREFFWQDFFMSGNILQLTVTDISMYKNAEDLQKRLAQLHAPGMRPNIRALDSKGNRVSDDYSRYVILKDEKIASDIVTNLKVARDRAVKRAKGQDRITIKRKYDSIIKEFEKTDAINFADAQAFSSPTSYRKKMHWFGKWDANQEEAYRKVISGKYTENDLNVLWQPLKPFVYAQIAKESGSKAVPLLKMGIQNKNSEYLLLMADALMRSEGVDSKLGAIYDVMEMSQGDWVGEGENREFVQNGKGIDTFMFESAVKTGITGVIDLNTKTPEQIRRFLWTGKGVLKQREGKNEDYNEIYVHTFHASAYTLQQEVPAHFKGEQQMGSQARIHAIADLRDFDADGKENTIIVNSKRIDPATGEYVTSPEEITIREFKKRYQEAIVENIELSFEELNKELGLNLKNKKLRNVILSRVLKNEILKDGRFGSDLLWACDVDADGNFNIPLSDPVQSGRIQQLLNSLIKNRINKQEVAGGALVQVSSWGVSKSKELGIRFESEDGKLLYTRKEFDRIMAGETVETKFDRSKYVGVGGKGFSMYKSYEEYVAKNQYKVAYFEAYVPIYDDRLLKYQNADGVIDIKQIEKDDPQLLEMIGYRIPTEGKYSMVPIKVVGFLPRSGEGIMLPADITLLTGSDFDVDKLYIMRRAISQKRDINNFVSEFLRELQEEQEEEHLDPDDLHINREMIIEALNTPESKKDTFSGGKKFYDRVHKAYREYSSKEKTGLTTHVTDRRDRNNNLIIDYLQAVLTSPLTTEQSMSPGNFDMVKEIGYLVAAYDNLSSLSREDLIDTVANDILHVDKSQLTNKPKSLILSQAFEALKDMDINQLKDISYVKVSLLYANTQVKFQQQNSVAGKLIGVFAQANTSHGFMTLLDNPTFNIEKGNGFKLNGKEFTGKVAIDTYYSIHDRKGRKNRISEVLASLLASSVDAVKDPVLNLFNINMTTVNIAIAMVRLGIPLDTIGWFLTTPIMKDAVSKFEMDNMTGNKPLSTVMFEMMKEIDDRNGGNVLNYYESKDITTEDLIAWHNRPDEVEEEGNEELRFLTQFEKDANTDDDLNTQDKIDYQLLGMAVRLLSMADGFRSITHMTRYNSITSSVGPFIANTYVSKASDMNFFRSPIIGENREKAAPYRDDATGVTYIANDLKKQIAENPIINAFRKYSYVLEGKLLGDNFIQGGTFGQRVFAEAVRRFPNLSNEVALRLSEFMVSYAMSSVREMPIFDLSDGQSIETTRRKIILDNVPNEAMAAKAKYPNNRLLQVIRTPVDERTGEVLMTVNMRGREETAIQDIKTGWTQLYRDEQDRIAHEGGTIQDNLAYRIIEYNFFRGGFGFSPKTFMRILPSELKLALPNYINNLKLDYDNGPVSVSTSNLLDQFMLNYGYANVPEIDIQQLAAVNKVPIEKFNEMQVVQGTSDITLDSGVALVKQPDGTYKWAVLRMTDKKDVFMFHYVDKLGGVESQGFEIDPTRNPWEIKSVFPQNGTRKANSQAQDRNSVSPSEVSSYADFEAAMMEFIGKWGNKAAKARLTGSFASKLQVMRNFAVNRIKKGSSTFNQIKDMLAELDLSDITEDRLNQLLDERNICR